MIFTDRIITVRKGESKINEPIIVYRGDYELEVRFTIMNSKFKFMSGTNLIESENASYGQLAILTPYGGNIFSEIAKCNDGTVTFVLTKAMLDQIEEVGLYSFQIRLFDYNKESRVSIPPVEFGIEVREPITSEDHDNSVNNAIVGYSIAKISDALNEEVPDTFNANGDYNKTIWETGDRITEGKLNKIEDAIDTINQNEKNDVAALDKRITSNYNVLDFNKATKQEVEIERQRITALSTLSEGSTTGDAEIIDARVGIDEVTHDNLGDAIRTQFGYLNLEPTYEEGANLFNINALIKNKTYKSSDSSGQLVETEGRSSTPLIPIDTDKFARIRFNYKAYKIVAFDIDKNFIKVNDSVDYAWLISSVEGAAYFGITFVDENVDYNKLMIMYSNDTSSAGATNILADVDYVPYKLSNKAYDKAVENSTNNKEKMDVILSGFKLEYVGNYFIGYSDGVFFNDSSTSWEQYSTVVVPNTVISTSRLRSNDISVSAGYNAKCLVAFVDIHDNIVSGSDVLEEVSSGYHSYELTVPEDAVKMLISVITGYAEEIDVKYLSGNILNTLTEKLTVLEKQADEDKCVLSTEPNGVFMSNHAICLVDDEITLVSSDNWERYQIGVIPNTTITISNLYTKSGGNNKTHVVMYDSLGNVVYHTEPINVSSRYLSYTINVPSDAVIMYICTVTGYFDQLRIRYEAGNMIDQLALNDGKIYEYIQSLHEQPCKFEYYGGFYLNNEGKPSSSSAWNAYKISDISSIPDIISFTGVFSGISTGNNDKCSLSVFDVEGNVLAHSPVIEAPEADENGDTVHMPSRTVTYNIDISEFIDEVSYIIVSVADLTSFTINIPIPEMKYKDGLLPTNMNIDDIMEYGTLDETTGGLVIGNDDSDTVISLYYFTLEGVNSIISMYAKSTYTETAPYIQYSNYLATFPIYSITDTNNFVKKEWRLPSFNKDLYGIKITVPAGSRLYIKGFSINPDNRRTLDVGGMRLDAHLGFDAYAPKNTMYAFETAAHAGYPACIVNPRVTADGIFVCCHDATINATARDEDGNAPSEDIYVAESTYEELLQWDFGRYKNVARFDTMNMRIPKLDDFFRLCANTGMKPMFSTHPIFTQEEWKAIRDMLIKHNILDRLTVKSFDIQNLANAFNVLGNDIEAYIFDVGGNAYEGYISNVQAYLPNATHVGIEIPQSEMTKEACDAIKAAGYFPSIWNLGRITGQRYEELREMGVVEVTDDFNCNYGLNY